MVVFEHTGAHLLRRDTWHWCQKFPDEKAVLSQACGELPNRVSLLSIPMDEVGSASSRTSVKEKIGFVTMAIGIGVAIVGVVSLFDSYIASQIAGALLLLIGSVIGSVGAKLSGSKKFNAGFLFKTSADNSIKIRVILFACILLFTISYYAYIGAI